MNLNTLMKIMNGSQLSINTFFDIVPIIIFKKIICDAKENQDKKQIFLFEE